MVTVAAGESSPAMLVCCYFSRSSVTANDSAICFQPNVSISGSCYSPLNWEDKSFASIADSSDHHQHHLLAVYLANIYTTHKIRVAAPTSSAISKCLFSAFTAVVVFVRNPAQG